MADRKNDTSEKSGRRHQVESLPRREEELQPDQTGAVKGGTFGMFAWHQSVVEGGFKAPDLEALER